MIIFIVAALWCTISTFVLMQYYPMCADKLKWYEKFMVGFIFLIAGPFFIIATICETFLTIILPEGWDDDDGPKQL